MTEQLRVGELFAGIGGFGLGLEQAWGARTVWTSEIEPAPVRVLAERLGVPNHGDITRIDWSAVERPDVLVGGFPCQDVSMAGLRAGLGPGTRSGLWAEFARAIEALRPPFVMIENVEGLLSAPATRARDVEPCPIHVGDNREPDLRALGAVLGDLAGLGFDAEWCLLPASAAGTPHRRNRIFVLAWDRAAADPDHLRRHGARHQPRGGAGPTHHGSDAGPDTDGSGRGQDSHHVRQRQADADRCVAPDPGRGPRAQAHPDRALAGGGSGAAAWGRFARAVERWEHVTGRPAPAPTVVNPRVGAGRSLSPAAVEWLMGFPDGWVTSLPIARSAALKAFGNALVPQQLAMAARILADRAVS